MIFRRATACANSGCVEVAFDEEGGAVVRSSFDDEHVLRFDREEWATFLAGVRAGEFDDP